MNLSSFHIKRDLRQDPPQQIIYAGKTISTYKNSMWLQTQPEPSRQYILSDTNARKVHYAYLTTVHKITGL